jgi:two-component system, response regulator YesN
MLAAGSRPVPDDLKATHHEAIAKCRTYLENHYMNNISLGQIAGYVHLSPVYLSRLLKKETGQTFLDILTQIRIAKSVELLRDQSIKSYEAASRVGFVDSKYFARLFRKYYGMTPTEFRTNIFRNKQHPGSDS